MKNPPYYIVRNGRAYWQPNGSMRKRGAQPRALGEDGEAARRLALELTDAWKERAGIIEEPDETEGFVYFLRMGAAIKVGFSRKPWDRINELKTGLPGHAVSIAIVEGTMGDERAVHVALKAHRIRGEWFRANQVTVNLMTSCLRRGRVKVGTESEFLQTFNTSENVVSRERAGEVIEFPV